MELVTTHRGRYAVEEIERKALGNRKAMTLWAIWDWDRRAYVDSDRDRDKMDEKARALNEADRGE